MDWARSITVDGSYIYATGDTYSFGAGNEDVFVLKTDLEGVIVIFEFSVFVVPVIVIIAVFAISRVKMQQYRK